MSWIILAVAIVLEVVGTVCMKLSYGFANIVPSILVFVFYGLSFVAMIQAIKEINIGTAYAVWSGLGTVMIAAIGYLWFKEPMGAVKLASVVLIIAGVVGLHWAEGRAT